MRVKKLDGYGSVLEGDTLILDASFSKKPIACTAMKVIRGGTEHEEVIYNMGKNHYFIVSMVLDGSSQVKEVLIVTK